MMMAVAGTRSSAAPFDFDRKGKPTPPWVYLVVGGSVLAHVAGAVWLYNQRYDMPAPVISDPPPVVLELWNRPPPEPDPVLTEETTRPPPPIHRVDNVIETDVIPSPLTPPDEITDPVPAGEILVAPTPTPTEGGTATEPTPPRPPSVISNPRWLSIPTAAQMERAYPRRAAQAEVGGSAVLSCSVTATGSVTGCSLVSETPAGMGFGNAAMSLARHFRLSPRTVDGQAVEGARVSIPLTFSLGD